MRWIKKHWLLTGVLVLLLALILAVAGFAASKLSLIQYSDGKTPEPAQAEADAQPQAPEELLIDTSGLELREPSAVAEGEIKAEEEVLNILVLGTDERTAGFSENARSDAMLLLSINRSEHTAKLVSLERGMGVPILEGQYEGQYDWLTHCFRYGGADLVMKEVRECFKVDVEKYVRLNFTALKGVVNALGGIDVELTQAEADYLRNGTGPGWNHLDGDMALNYARLREIDSDWQRIVRQRTVIQACVNQLGDASLKELNQLLDEVLPMIETNFTPMEIAALTLELPNFLNVQFEQMTIPAAGTYGYMIGMEGRDMFAPDFEENARILQEFFYGPEETE